MSGFIKHFENGGKNMSFVIKHDMCLEKYNEIWDKIKGKLNIKFYSMPVYDEKYIKAKVREFNGVIKTNFLTLFRTVRSGEVSKKALYHLFPCNFYKRRN